MSVFVCVYFCLRMRMRMRMRIVLVVIIWIIIGLPFIIGLMIKGSPIIIQIMTTNTILIPNDWAHYCHSADNIIVLIIIIGLIDFIRPVYYNRANYEPWLIIIKKLNTIKGINIINGLNDIMKIILGLLFIIGLIYHRAY